MKSNFLAILMIGFGSNKWEGKQELNQTAQNKYFETSFQWIGSTDLSLHILFWAELIGLGLPD